MLKSQEDHNVCGKYFIEAHPTMLACLCDVLGGGVSNWKYYKPRPGCGADTAAVQAATANLTINNAAPRLYESTAQTTHHRTLGQDRTTGQLCYKLR